MSREEFEKWISSPPFERGITRMHEKSAWPGSYRPLDVDLAWQAWQAATAMQEARVRELGRAFRDLYEYYCTGYSEEVEKIEERAKKALESLSATARSA